MSFDNNDVKSRQPGEGGIRSLFSARTILFVLAVLLIAACSDKKPVDSVAPDPVPIAVAAVERVVQDRTVDVSGSVVSKDNPVRVAFLVAGKVIRVEPREGDLVTCGQVLAAIDPVDYRLAVKAAAAQVSEARIARKQAADELARMRYLFERKSLAPNDFEKFEAKWRLSESKLEEAEAGLAIQQKRLADASLKAPMDGFVTRRMVEPGQTVSAGMPAFEIATLDPVEIQVGVPETDIARVRAGQKAAITVAALGGETFEGTVRLVNVGADPETRTYMTRILVPNPEHRLRLGMVAKAGIDVGEQMEAMVLPATAIVRDPRKITIVYVYYPDRQCVYGTRVTVGRVLGQKVTIVSGLSGDEQVVVAGQDKLRDGARVSVTAGAGSSVPAQGKAS
ncbi:efflux RND transporter periplasmic adaptor subunit [uncultured Desulfosarcina sp.]|uniref:efflux RND transporter periplasmic adaptor subunit n=1 Tax=uncultured Desulfosarcina sp. TaxID=218289 RepID=UPI0029C7F3F7|nr:efflux RND transporter periplasmic adaptor subunit [uncultured Desulfosarcina sp.]